MPASLSRSPLRKPVSSVLSLCTAEPEPFFTQITLTDGDTAGCGHLPFIIWLLCVLSPETLVLIGASRSVRETLNQAIHNQILPTRLVETRLFSLEKEADSAVYYYASPSWETPEHLKSELDKLPAGSLVLLGGTASPAGRPLWAEFEKTFLTFSFFHAGGLGLLATTPPHNTDVSFILTKNSTRSEDGLLKKTLLRERFSQAGQFWENKALLSAQTDKIQGLQEELRQQQLLFLNTKQEKTSLKANLDAERTRLETENSTLHAYATFWRNHALVLREANTALSASLSRALLHFHRNAEVWAVFSQEVRSRAEGLNALRDFLSTPAGFLRSLARTMVRGSMAPFVPDLPTPPDLTEPDITIPPPVMSEQPEPPALTDAMITDSSIPLPSVQADHTSALQPVTLRNPRHKVLFVAGEPESPGVQYRCIRNAAACLRAGHEARWKPCADVNPDDLSWADIVILWRVEFSGHVDILLQLARENGAGIIFDTDDITFLPHLARFDIIDGIRSIGATEQRIETIFTEMRRTMMRSDLCIAPTDTLAGLMRINKPLTYTVPNTFDSDSLRRSRMAMRKKHWIGSDGFVRIGYATGSRTHQRDFARVAGILAKLMLERADLRLVLFRESGNHRPVLLMNEFPELTPVSDQIEWRDMVPLPELPEETARFDISIAPLEAGSLFCNAKSELKFFEAALAGVPSIVSPTAPFRQCIVDGISGFLADTPEEWETALRTLLENPDLRRRMADAAYHGSLWYFGPQRQALVFDSIFEGLGGEQAAARASELQIARGAYRSKGLPDVPPHEVLFHQDRMDEAAITVIITSYNYEAFILEALESVRAQTIDLLDLVVVDDGSSDDSIALIAAWMTQHSARFNRLILLKTTVNAGLGGARNCGVTHAETSFFLPLDADNRLLPDACASLLAATNEMTAYAYPILEQFGEPTRHKVLGDKPYHPMQLVAGNYIDAMALVAKWAWAAAGGYYVSRSAMGWEDYDLWCSFAELGLQGTHVPEILAEYRVHRTSMTSSVTEQDAHKQRVVELVESRHGWIKLVQKAAKDREKVS
ncbi:glycosyl transferase [Acetobacter cerevisiae]|uniref:Glycosyl transferase n=1 Tax=Acetobacter cerevisiae TaxID=178900 RepID=A0A149VAD8_9PROT|nr:glycosyl transferase [Acetobacter cerevisiae]